ncbi:MAG: S-layer homology domain-containing protein [Clostridia bacterium]|nr:S-layer homology domain-containing protein [Clostridia bacterium]
MRKTCTILLCVCMLFWFIPVQNAVGVQERALQGGMKVRIGNIIVGKVDINTKFSVPVIIENTSEFDPYGYDLNIEFKKEYFKFDSVDVIGHADAQATDGVLNIRYNSKRPIQPKSSDGTFILINFKIEDIPLPKIYPITFRGEKKLFSDTGSLIDTTSSDGWIEVVTKLEKGDLDGNGTVGDRDSEYIKDYVLGRICCFPAQRTRDSDNGKDLADFVMDRIGTRIMANDYVFCKRYEYNFANYFPWESGEAAYAKIEDVKGSPGSSISVPVRFEKTSGHHSIDYFNVIIKYDNSSFKFEGVEGKNIESTEVSGYIYIMGSTSTSTLTAIRLKAKPEIKASIYNLEFEAHESGLFTDVERNLLIITGSAPLEIDTNYLSGSIIIDASTPTPTRSPSPTATVTPTATATPSTFTPAPTYNPVLSPTPIPTPTNPPIPNIATATPNTAITVSPTAVPTATPPPTPTTTSLPTFVAQTATPTPVIIEPSPSIPLVLPRFNDIEGHWAQVGIEALAGRGIVEGTGGRKFEPDRHVTRAECAKIMTVYLKNADWQLDYESFKDVKKGSWYFTYVTSAVKSGILKGRPDKTFGPSEKIKREDVALLFSRIIELYISSEQVGFEVIKNKFTDSSSISPYARYGFATSVAHRIISGRLVDGKRLLCPKEPVTRAELATMLYRLIEKMPEI